MEHEVIDSSPEPQRSLESYLLRLWSVQLDHPSIGVTDGFFDLGGSSMQAIEMLMTVTDQLGKELDYAEFFRDPCVSTLCALLDVVAEQRSAHKLCDS